MYGGCQGALNCSPMMPRNKILPNSCTSDRCDFWTLEPQFRYIRRGRLDIDVLTHILMSGQRIEIFFLSLNKYPRVYSVKKKRPKLVFAMRVNWHFSTRFFCQSNRYFQSTYENVSIYQDFDDYLYCFWDRISRFIYEEIFCYWRRKINALVTRCPNMAWQSQLLYYIQGVSFIYVYFIKRDLKFNKSTSLWWIE